MANVWIQSADFSVAELGDLERDDATRAFETHDWASERGLQSALEARGAELCPPGMGFVLDRHILHVCPQDNESIVH